jgi:hypothetical protein
MYRTPAGPPPAPDPHIVYPGWGWGPIVVGRASAEDVLAQVGRDAKVCRHSPSGEIFEIAYDYRAEDAYEPDRPAQAGRPARFEVEFGLVKAIVVGVYQTELVTREGVRIGSRREEAAERLGPPSELLRGKDLDTLRYVHLGIEIDVDRSDDEVSSMTIFRARW